MSSSGTPTNSKRGSSSNGNGSRFSMRIPTRSLFTAMADEKISRKTSASAVSRSWRTSIGPQLSSEPRARALDQYVRMTIGSFMPIGEVIEPCPQDAGVDLADAVSSPAGVGQ